MYFFFFFNDTATTEIYTYCHTLSLHDALPIYVTPRDFSEPAWQSFCECLDYVQLDAQVADDYARLAATLKDCDQRTRVFYLATSPSLFTGICENLGAAGLVTPSSRVVLEKPLGRDFESSRANTDNENRHTWGREGVCKTGTVERVAG